MSSFFSSLNQFFGLADPAPDAPEAAPVAVPQPAAVPLTSPVPGCDDDTWSAYEALMADREGVRYVVYYDSRGKPTGGEGHLILPSDGLSVGDDIPDETVRRWFTHDGADAMDHAVTQARQAGITSQAFLPYLASVCFQLGNAWTGKFPNTWRMICNGQYAKAALAINGTPWQAQTPKRTADFQAALRALPAKAA